MAQKTAHTAIYKHSRNNHKPHKQGSFFSSTSKTFPLSHGGKLRNQRCGRKARPLSTREPLHLVFKLNKHRLRHRSLRSHQGFKLVQAIVRKYSKHFYVQIEQISIQHDHIHCLIRTKRRSQYQNFFRVVAGQIAQRFLKEGLCLGCDPSFQPIQVPQQSVTGTNPTQAKTPKQAGAKLYTQTDTQTNTPAKPRFWLYRPFTRVVRGFKAYRIVKDYIQLNEKEVTGTLKYSVNRLKGLSSGEWKLLWA